MRRNPCGLRGAGAKDRQVLTGWFSAELHQPEDVNAGREYVEARGAHVHVAECLYEAARWSSSGHYEQAH